MRPAIVPCLLALAAGAFCPGAMAGESGPAAEAARDAQFDAVAKLIAAEFRLTGERQVAAFAQAGHPDAGDWYAKTLRWYWIDHFRNVLTGANADALFKEADTLQKEIEGAGDQVPAVARKIIAAASGMIRQVNDVAKEVNPESPPPLTGAANWAPEKKAKVTRAVEQLVKIAGAEFAAKVAAAQKFAKDNDEKIANLDQEGKEWQALAHKSCLLWDEALQSFVIAHIALREIATRGQAWGIDPTPAKAFLAGVTKTHAKSLIDVDFLWGEMYPPLRARIAVLLAEGNRQGLKECAANDVDSNMQEVFKVKPTDFKDPAQRAGFTLLQVNLWANALKWCVDVGDDAAIKRGQALWKQFQEGYKDSQVVRPDGKDPELAETASKVWIAAARLHLIAKDTSTAKNLFSAVAGAKGNRYAANAGEWITWQVSNTGGGGSGDYGAQPVPADPNGALNTAKALLREKDQTTDPAKIRQFTVSAIDSLRGGLLGLSTTDQAAWIELAPQIYERLAAAYSGLGLHLQASATVIDGLRRIAARNGEAKAKGNPWRGKDEKFNALGLHVQRLVKNGLVFSLNGAAEVKLPAAQSLSNQVIELAQKISPEDTGDNLLWLPIYEKIRKGEFESALADADALVKKRPEQTGKGFGIAANALQSWIDKLEKDGDGTKTKRDELAKDLLKRCDQRESEIKPLLAKQPVPKEAQRDAAQIESIRQFLAIKQGRFAEVMDKLGPLLLSSPPSDEAIAAQALSDLCRAAGEFYKSVNTATGQSDPAPLLANWSRYQQAYAAHGKLRTKLASQQAKVDRAASNLAFVFNSIRVQADWMRTNGKVPSDSAQKMADIETTAKRAFADLYEPRLGKTSKPSEIWLVADLLWEAGEHARAVRLYELFRDVLKASKPMESFRTDPKAWLDEKEKLLGSRQELRPSWLKVRDLLEDKTPIKAYWEKGGLVKDFGEKPLDFVRAVVSARELRADIDKQKDRLGATLLQQFVSALDDLDATTQALSQDIRSRARLADAYRSAGRKQEAQKLFSELFDYDPWDEDFSTAFVELVLDRLKSGGEAVPKAELSKARDIAIDNRSKITQGSEGFWMAAIQVLELSAALNDLEPINNRLRWINVNRSDLTRDLCKAPVSQGGITDDPRVRRPASPQAVELAQRFLGIYAVNGVQQKPTYRLDPIDDNGTTVQVFVDAGAPKFELIDVKDRDDEPLRILWEVGKAPPTPAPEPVPEPIGGSATAAAGSATAAASATVTGSATPATTSSTTAAGSKP